MKTGGVRHLYVHVPFCRARCSYCDFASETLGPHARAGRVHEYVEAMFHELNDQRGMLAPRLSTAYVGGGTPTTLPRESLAALVSSLAGLLAPGAELTVEANPGCFDQGLLDQLQGAGCTRVSLGVQSFSSQLRRALGRRVSQKDTESAVEALAGRPGMEWSLDLVMGIPGQDMRSLGHDLEQALAASPPHISLYDLTYTPAYERFLAGAGLPDRAQAESFAEEGYALAVERLEHAGYRRYEVSNFALPGHESRHNLGYWRGEDYLGLGPSAVSTVGGERWTNPSDLAGYLAGKPAEREYLPPATRLFERAMLGLRTAEGVPGAEVRPVVDPDAWEAAQGRGLAVTRCGTLFLTQRGLDVSNALLAEVLVVPDQRAFPAGV